jgi:membrane-associated phospholipid phosphatase
LLELSIPGPGRDMSRDFIYKWVIIAVTIATTAVLILAQGLQFPVQDLWTPIGVAAALAAAAWYYRMKNEENFVAALTALMFLTFYTACYAVMMYAGAAIGMPVIDDALVQFDAACGIKLPDVVQWAHSHPEIELLLQWSYNSLLWQTPLVIVVLGFTGELKSLRQFVLQFMLGTWICALFFFALPAAGPFTVFDIEMNATQTRYLQHFQELREGVRTVVTWNNAEGLITFPSFHTTWAMLLAWAVRKRLWLFLPSVLVNIAVIAATMTTGWHYFGDVFAGVAIGVGTICMATRMTAEPQREEIDRDSQVEIRLSQLREESAARVRTLSEKRPQPVKS